MELNTTQSNADTDDNVTELTLDELGQVSGGQGTFLKFTFSTVFTTKVSW